jgi:hypothetical protein
LAQHKSGTRALGVAVAAAASDSTASPSLATQQFEGSTEITCEPGPQLTENTQHLHYKDQTVTAVAVQASTKLLTAVFFTIQSFGV